MEITNEERREVAGRIRERICRNHRAAWDVVLELSYIDVFGDRFRMNKEFTLFLADLIDRPTCRNVSGRQDVFECSECKFRAEVVCEEGNEYGDIFSTPFMPRFCPNCGAEVQE